MSAVEANTGEVAILVVDDDARNLMVLEALLSDFGLTIVTAQSGAECLRELLQRDFALILLDVQMPVMDGIETATIIRGRPGTKHLPIIFLTAFSHSDEIVTRAYEVGAVDFLFKPLQPAALRSKVTIFVELYRKRKEVEAAEQRARDQSLAELRATISADVLRAQMLVERKASARMKLLAEVATSLLATPAPRHVLPQLTGQVAEHLELDTCAVYLGDASAGRIELVGACGFDTTDPPQAELLAAVEPWLSGVLARRVTVFDRDAGLGMPAGWERRGAVAAFTIAMGPDVLGVLLVSRTTEGPLDDEAATIGFVCDQIALALHRERLTAQLQSRTDALAAADSRKDEFLAVLGHELRNPLASLRYALELWRSDGQPSVIRNVFDRQVQQLHRMVDDLLDVSRISRGKIELRTAPASVQEIVEQALEQTEPLLSAKGHTCELDLPRLPIRLVADSVRLTQVVANLLNNSARYTDPGGVIRVVAVRDGDDLIIRVQDNGQGIAPTMLNGVFDLFVQANHTRDPTHGGLGLGLTLVRRLVELHGGSVTASSEGFGRGSTFTVRLPIVVPISAEPQAADSPTPRVDGLQVVVVEDNVDAREMLEMYLSACGHDVRVAEDGLSGLAELCAAPPAIAFVDIGLPGIDGYELARRFRSRCPNAPTRLIAVTGYGQDSDRRRALEAGFDEHCVKPMDGARLSRVLRDDVTRVTA